MTRTALALGLALAILLVHMFSRRPPADDVRGAWFATPCDGREMRVEFTVRSRLRSADCLNAAAFAGLAEGEADARHETPARFRLARDAGTLTLEGSFLRRTGAGRFLFTPNPRYLASLRALGIDTAPLTDAKRPANVLLDYALLDVSLAYIRSLQREGCRESSARAYLELKALRITPEYLRELRYVGYTDLPGGQIADLATHGVTGRYVRALEAEGYVNLAPSEIVLLRVADVTPEKIRAYLRLITERPTPGQLVVSGTQGSLALPKGPFIGVGRSRAPAASTEVTK